MAASVSASRVPHPSELIRTSARAERAAVSSQMGWPLGPRAACGQAQSQRLADHLRGRSRAYKLGATARSRAGVAAHLRRVLEGDLLLHEARADRLHLAGVLAVLRQQRNPARHQHARQRA